MTGERELRGSALLEYFQPLFEFLQKENSHRVNANSVDSESPDHTIPISVGGVFLGFVIVVIVGYIIFRRRAGKRNATA